ncbi:hypothetical protein LWI28_013543 [Acer negundo]|uniref:Uncharacterized protein n=1 Tax=Acer negundo TaxID=4023 RepID=A0AAD5IDR0_ACENE|nr:hypothetical protein LWI28_013543 [Acer negundo]KAK4840104.1 hypothetical protein QYF36_027514 [Acer negundo]
MAIELESSGMSPRISFSHDFCLSDEIIVPVEQQQQHPLRSNSSSGMDFDFCVRKSFDQDSSSADELFSDGKILPTQVKKKKINNNTPQALPLPPAGYNKNDQDHESLKGISNKSTAVMRDESGDGLEEKQQSSSNKSFWKFKRSSSLNCGSGYGRSLCPLPLLSRSNSTGSAHKDNNNSHTRSASSIRSSSHSSSSNYLKPPLKKSAYGAYGNGIQVNPVLNVPSGNLFGLGSIFFNAKDKNKKK